MTLENADVCSFCLGLVKFRSGAGDLPLQLPHHPSFGALTQSGLTCRLCKTIASMWVDDESDLRRFTRFPSESEPFVNLSNKDNWGVVLKVKGFQESSLGVCWTYSEFSFNNPNTPLVVVSDLTIVSCRISDPASDEPSWKGPTTSLDDKVNSIKSWLQDCRSGESAGHQECRSVPWMPRRLLRVGLDGAPPRLVRGDQVADIDRGRLVEYTALSHCWGTGGLPVWTTKDNLGQFSEAIPADLFPRTFSDALDITRRLEIPYIWIDALCIVQDDNQEWQQEAARMDKIYQGSSLTIAAADSTDSTQGCFTVQHDGGFKENEVFFRTHGSGSKCSQGVHSTPGPQGKDQSCKDDLLVRVYKNDMRNRAEKTAVSYRGWTLQEQLLSPRLVSCMSPDIHWFCQGSYKTQCGIDMTAPAGDGLLHFVQSTHDGIPLSRERDHAARESWYQIVDNYSRRRFTYPSDRIPAIAGAIEHMAKQLGDESILGLWKGSFVNDLAWIRISSPPKPLDSSLSALPSWTWLASPGRAVTGFWTRWDEKPGNGLKSRLRSHLTLLDWEVNWTAIPYTSPLQSAHVCVKGSIREIEISPFPQGDESNPPYFQVFGENITITDKVRIPWRCAGQFDHMKIKKGGTYPCLLLKSRPMEGNHGINELFLMLELVEDVNTEHSQEEDGRRVYRRIGIGQIWGDAPTFDTENTTSVVLV